MGSSNKHIHVQPTGDGDWAVRRRGQDRAVACASTQAEAIERGRQTA